MTDLGSLGAYRSEAAGINDAGQVVGYSWTDDTAGISRAFITGPDGVSMTDLGTLGGSYSVASGINDIGQVVGYSYTDPGLYHAFITGPDGVGMTDLGSVVNLPASFTYFSATAINNHGQLAAVGEVPVVPEPEIYSNLELPQFLGMMSQLL
jgi:probable HAF family extracellular repeat protein